MARACAADNDEPVSDTITATRKQKTNRANFMKLLLNPFSGRLLLL
jgi:hypothetical protein